MFENSLRQLRLLPILVIVAMIAFAVRAGDVLIAVNSGAANAQSATEDGPLTAPTPSQNTLSQAVQSKNENDKTEKNRKKTEKNRKKSEKKSKKI